MAADMTAQKGDAPIEEIASKLIDELHMKGAEPASAEAAPQETIDQKLAALDPLIQAASDRSDVDELRRLGIQGRAIVQADRERVAKEKADANDFLQEAMKESDDVSATSARADVQAWEKYESDFKPFWDQQDEYFGGLMNIAETLGESTPAEPAPAPEPAPEPAPAAPTPAPSKIKPIPPKAVPAQPTPEPAPEPTPAPAAKELSDEEEQERAAGEGMTAVQPPPVEPAPEPSPAPESPAALPAESGPMKSEERLKAAMEEIEQARKEFGDKAEAMIERMKQELIDKIKSGSGIPPSTP